MRSILTVFYDQHDVECNQKYNKTLPYSFHLKAVVAQCCKYLTLVPEDARHYIKIAAAGHDLIEDARLTYNDIIDIMKAWGYKLEVPKLTADIIYSCTELKGRNRSERQGPEFFDILKKNRLGVFVKLCDIMSNSLFSTLTVSSMLDKYKAEFPHLKEQLYVEGEYDPIWKDLEKILGS